MSVLSLHRTDDYIHFDETECRAAGRARAAEYAEAQPFPHIVIDDFLDANVLRRIAARYPATEGKQFFDRDQERLKFQFHAQEVPNGIARNLLAELNGQAFLGFLEELTGIEGLISDPYLNGGGLHLTKRGGHLGVHADFNLHIGIKAERRLNLLVYLNDDWDPSFGGELELWDRQMQRPEKKVAPVIGRAVIFNTALDSFHGHPDPLACPPERDRRSIATYYYTAIEAGAGAMPVRGTNFQPRPDSSDKRDWESAYFHWVKDWVPARMQPLALRVGGRVGRAAGRG